MQPNGKLVIAILFAVFAMLFLKGVLAPYGGELDNPYPIGYLAGDTMWHYAYTDALRDAGSTRELPSFFALGEEGLVYFQPVVFYHIAAAFADLTGVPTYEATMIVAALMGALIGLLITAAVRRVIGDWAYLGLPMMIIAATSPFVQVFSWGWHIAISGVLGLVLFVALITERVRFKPLVIGVVLGLTVLAHLDSFVYAIAICLAFAAFFVVKRRWVDLRSLVVPSLIALGVVVVMTGWYFIVLSKTWFVGRSLIEWFVPYAVPWDAELINLGFWLVPVLIGVVVAIVVALRSGDERYVPFLSLFVLSLSLYIGLERIVRYNFLIPILLAPLAAIAFSRAPKDLARWSAIGSFVMIILIFGSAQLLPVGATMLSPVEWYAFEVLAEQGDDPVLYLAHRVGTGQPHALFAAKRTPVTVRWESFEGHDGTLPVRAMCDTKGGGVTRSLTLSEADLGLCNGIENRSICDFSTVYIGAYPNENIMNVQNAIAQELIEQGAEPILMEQSLLILDTRGACS
jgi:hypothetical protein